MNNTAKNHFLLMLLLMLAALLVVGQLYVTLPFSVRLGGRWQVSQAQASWVGSAFGFAYASGFLLLGRLSDQYGRRQVLSGALVLLALASAAVALASRFELLLGARAVQGLVAALFAPTALALVAERLPVRWRALGISLMSFAFLAAAPLAQLLAVQAAGWRFAELMWLCAVLYLLLAVALAGVLAGNAVQSEALEVGVQGGGKAQLWQPALVGTWLAAGAVLFALVAFYAAAQSLALTAKQLQAIRLAGLPPLLLSLVAARLVARVGTVGVARIGFVVAALAMLLVVATGGWIFWLLASALLAAGVALAVPGLIGTVAMHAASSIRARAMSLYAFALFCGASLAPPVAQLLLPFGWAALLLVSFGALVLAAVLVGGWPAKADVRRRWRGLSLCLCAVLLSTVGKNEARAENRFSTAMEVVKMQLKENDLSALMAYAGVAATHHESGRKKVHVDGEAAVLIRHERVDGRNSSLGGEHFSVLLADGGALQGCAHITLDLAGKSLPTRERSEEVARAFLQQFAPDLLPDLELHWIEAHEETVRTAAGDVTLAGMKVKMRNPADGKWFWVIVGSDEKALIFERDIVWISFPGHRQTEKWLHDDWLQEKGERTVAGF